MARLIRDNPDFFRGDALKDGAVMSVGAVASGWIADKIGMPVLRGVWSGFATANNVAAQVANVLATTASTVALDMLAGLLKVPAASRKALATGGYVLAGARAISIALPDFQLSYQLPVLPGLDALASSVASFGAPRSVAALPSGIAAPAPAPAPVLRAVASETGL